MTPVMQSKLYSVDGIHAGNCFAACLASLLNIPLWMVPPFEDMFHRDNWRSRVNEWLLEMYRMELARADGDCMDDLVDYYIASGASERGVMHSVIYRKGVMIHDPHPSGTGIGSVVWSQWLEARP